MTTKRRSHSNFRKKEPLIFSNALKSAKTEEQHIYGNTTSTLQAELSITGIMGGGEGKLKCCLESILISKEMKAFWTIKLQNLLSNWP